MQRSPALRGLRCGAVERAEAVAAIAISLGHPFGMTGVRIMTALLNDLETSDATIGLETMYVAQGQGRRMLVERI